MTQDEIIALAKSHGAIVRACNDGTGDLHKDQYHTVFFGGLDQLQAFAASLLAAPSQAVSVCPDCLGTGLVDASGFGDEEPCDCMTSPAPATPREITDEDVERAVRVFASAESLRVVLADFLARKGAQK